ncbi:CsbD family protein [Serratia nevei]|uniref:CsbD family protein n=1 Tax=Serratia nevei TaxID=2703794 RepID=UPI003FA6CDCA
MFKKAENKTEEFTNATQEKLSELTESSEKQIRSAGNKYISQGSEALQDAADTVKEQVESNPVGAVVIASLAGVFLGFILGRK